MKVGHLPLCSYFICQSSVILVTYGYNKWPQNLWLKITEIYTFTVLFQLHWAKIEVSTWLHSFWRLQGRVFLNILASGNWRHFLVVTALFQSPPAWSMLAPLLYVIFLCLCSIRTLVTGFRNHLDNPGYSSISRYLTQSYLQRVCYLKRQHSGSRD